MDSNLNQLEAKVVEAIELIKGLRGENGRLQQRCEDLESQLADREETENRLNQELEDTRLRAREFEIYEEKRKEIENKVGGLLQKLEALG